MSAQSFDLSTLDSSTGFIINGENQEQLGFSVSPAGDINGDGIADLVIGAPSSDLDDKGNAGKSYVVFGSKDGFNPTIDFATLDGTKGFVINGAEEGDQSGYSVSNLGDLNGDGVDDLAIGAPGDIGNSLGKVHIIFGSKETSYFNNPIDLSDLGNKGFTVEGSGFSSNAGWAVSSAGDINGDGIKDLLIGATNDGNNGPSIVGESYVIFGTENFNSTINLDDSDQFGVNDGLIIISNEENNLGYSVSSAGDINGDGIDDLIIGAPYADTNGNNSGSTFVIYGRDKNNPFTNTFAEGIINVSELNLEDGFVINGQGVDQSGFSVSKAGDINGDGIGDLIIGARDGGTNYTGKTYVVFGKNGKFDSNINLADLDGSNGFAINGIEEVGNSGWAVSALGDVNDDGIDDIIVSAPNANESKGQAYVIYGSKADFGSSFDLSSFNGDNGFVIDGLIANGQFGYSVSGAGDVNDDSVNDLIISAPFADSNNGAAYVVFGTSVNKAPTGLSLSNSAIDENVDPNSIVASFITTDPDQNDSFKYSFVDGEDNDNSAFTIVGHQLLINNSPDFETKNSYKIRVKTEDAAGASLTQVLTVNINDVNENPVVPPVLTPLLTQVGSDVF
ncbi:MAG: cadherin domain-containing protein, partial [Cuspidothrix sp.]